jgi:DNA-binding NarL/FixJ family response regulator
VFPTSRPFCLAAGRHELLSGELGAKVVSPNGSPALEPLSKRERDIIHLLALCSTNPEIAAQAQPVGGFSRTELGVDGYG